LEDYKYIQEIEQEEKGVSFDPDRFNSVLKRSFPWILFLLIVALLLAYLAIRYTKPLYESSSILKLNIKREASVLGLQEYDEEQVYNSLSSEMELLKSRLFFNRVIDALNLDLSIYTIGKILLDERYNNPPFTVIKEIKYQGVYNRPFRVEIINTNQFILSYTIDGQHFESTYSFGEKIETEHFMFKIELTDYYQHGTQDNEFFFYVYSRQYLLDYIADNMSVIPLNLNANTIQISFKGYNRFKARDLVHAIDTIYLNYTQEEKNKANSQRIAFLNQQLESTEQRLADFEDYFERFIINNKSIDLSDNLAETIDILNSLDSQEYNIKILQMRLEQLQQEIVSERKLSLSYTDYRLLPGNVIEEINNLNDLIEKRESVLMSHNENTLVYKKSAEEIETLYNQVHRFIIDYYEELDQRLEDIRTKRDALESKFVGMPSKNTEYAKSQRYYSLYEGFYLSLMQKKAEYQLAIAGTLTDFKILSPASFPVDPLKPQKELIYGIGLAVWLVLSFFLIGIGYLSFNKITGLKEIERLTDIPILGSVPFYFSEKLKVSKIIVEEDSKSAISEALRSIRTNMKFVIQENTSGIIASVSSTVSGEGKTFVGLNLATVFALSGKRVLVMDMDLRKPKFRRVFENIPQDRGISTILIGKDSLEDCIIPSDIENLDLLASGPVPPSGCSIFRGAISSRCIQWPAMRPTHSPWPR